jgi:hypothetical protein
MAERVVLSHPSALSRWGRLQIDHHTFRGWLRRSHDRLAEGDRFEEFLDTGCCGRSHHVTFAVEAVEGDGRVTDDTSFEFVERPGCDREGGWGARSESGP